MKHFYINSNFTNPFNSTNISDGYRLLAFTNWTGNYPMLLEMQEINANLVTHLIENKSHLKLWQLFMNLKGNDNFLNLIIKHFGWQDLPATWYTEFFEFMKYKLEVAQIGFSREMKELIMENDFDAMDFLPFEDLLNDFFYIKKELYENLKIIKVQEVI